MKSVAATIVLILSMRALPSSGSCATVNEFLRTLANKPEATHADCITGVAIVLGMKKNLESVPKIMQQLQKRHILDADDVDGGLDREHVMATARRGFACLLFMRAMHDKGGLMCRIFPGSKRQAYHHLEYIGMIPPGGPWVHVSGPELISLITLAKERRRK